MPNSQQPKYAHLLVIALVTSVLTSSVLAYKYIAIGGIKFGAPAVLYPFSLVIGDVLSEIYGFKRTRNAIFISLICYCFFVLISQITVMLPPAPEWTLQPEYEKFFSTTYRVFIATSLAFVVSQIVNSYVFIKIKIMMHGRSFYVRALIATIVGELAHTTVIAPILFGNILTLDKIFDLIITATSIKVAVESVLLPFTLLVIKKLKKLEDSDYYDA